LIKTNGVMELRLEYIFLLLFSKLKKSTRRKKCGVGERDPSDAGFHTHKIRRYEKLLLCTIYLATTMPSYSIWINLSHITLKKN